VTNPVETANGVRSVLIGLNLAEPMFFRLRYGSQTVAETVMVTVTDANGVQARPAKRCRSNRCSKFLGGV